MKAIEKYIPGFEGRYVVSNFGYVRKVGTDKKNYGTINNRNDNIVHITDNNGKSRIFSMSRLVASVFIPNPQDKSQVDHIDTNRRNNRADNLRWVWPKENAENFKTAIHRLERPLPFISRKTRKGCVAEMPDGERIYKHSISEMARHFNCSECSISRCLNGSQPFLFGQIKIRPWVPGIQAKLI